LVVVCLYLLLSLTLALIFVFTLSKGLVIGITHGKATLLGILIVIVVAKGLDVVIAL
jgi:hypothetical protein